MPLRDRAAQFSPFAALSGYDSEISEASRFTDEKLILTEDAERELNEKCAFLSENSSERPEVTVEYFLPDSRRSGGVYRTVTGNFRRFDEEKHTLVFVSGEEIPLESICKITVRS